MQQYHRMKAEHPGALLFFRMGDFYELFFEDAVTASRALEIALTSRSKDKDGAPIPMCGVPYHAGAAYVGRLVKQGFRVALCEQMEDPRTAKGVVQREVVRVITPGTQLETSALDAGEPAFVLALAPRDAGLGRGLAGRDHRRVRGRGMGGRRRAGTACATSWAARARARSSSPRGRACPPWLSDAGAAGGGDPAGGARRPRASTRARGRRELLAHFGVQNLEAFGCEDRPLATAAAGAALRYVRETQRRDLAHVTGLRTRDAADGLAIDAGTRRNLELVETLADGSRRGTLLGGPRRDADRHGRPGHARLDPAPAHQPRAHPGPARRRGGAGLPHHRARAPARGAGRACRTSTASWAASPWAPPGPRDLAALAHRCARSPPPPRPSSECVAPLVRGELKDLDPPARRGRRRSSDVIVDEPPATLRDGGAIRAGVDAELDELREVSHGGRTTIAAIEERERARTGIASLKVRFNRVFGYYIEVSKSNLGAHPRRLHPQADDRGRRALRHPRAEGVRGQDPPRRRAHPRQGGGDLRGLARPRGRRGAARAAHGRARPRSSTCWPRWPRCPAATTTSSRG